MTKSGSGSWPSDAMHAGSLLVVVDIREWKIFDVPLIHGSMRIRKGVWPGSRGSKVSRKEASPLRCLIVSAIASTEYQL